MHLLPQIKDETEATRVGSDVSLENVAAWVKSRKVKLKTEYMKRERLYLVHVKSKMFEDLECVALHEQLGTAIGQAIEWIEKEFTLKPQGSCDRDG